MGFPMKTYGNSNDSDRKDFNDNEGYIGGGTYNYAFYPNPFSDVLIISSTQKIESVWIVKGEATSAYQDINFSDYFKTEVLDTVGINEKSLLMFNNLNATKELNINLSDKIDDGIYKIIVKTEEASLFWFSIIKSNEDLKTIEDIYFPW